MLGTAHHWNKFFGILQEKEICYKKKISYDFFFSPGKQIYYLKNIITVSTKKNKNALIVQFVFLWWEI